MFVRLFRIEASESFGKSLAGAIYKEEKWRNGDQKSYCKKCCFLSSTVKNEIPINCDQVNHLKPDEECNPPTLNGKNYLTK